MPHEIQKQNFDLIVIGSGPAGEKGAAQAAYFGKKVALVEMHQYLGGAAASTTIPSKTLRETSLALSGIRARHLHGVDLSLKRQATVKDFLHHERKVKDAERKRVKDNMLLHNVVQHLTMEEKQDAMGLILNTGSNIIGEGELDKDIFDLGYTLFCRMSFLLEDNASLDPVYIYYFSVCNE